MVRMAMVKLVMEMVGNGNGNGAGGGGNGNGGGNGGGNSGGESFISFIIQMLERCLMVDMVCMQISLKTKKSYDTRR